MDDSKIKTSLNLNRKLYGQIKAKAALEGITLTELLERIIRDYLGEG